MEETEREREHGLRVACHLTRTHCRHLGQHWHNKTFSTHFSQSCCKCDILHLLTHLALFCIFAAALHATNATPRFGHFASFGATNMRRVHRWKNKFPFDGHGISDCKGNGKGMKCKAREGKGREGKVEAGDWKWSQVHSAFGILINIKECRKKKLTSNIK